jgi:hypothetical protein
LLRRTRDMCKWYPVCPMKVFFERGVLDAHWIEQVCFGNRIQQVFSRMIPFCRQFQRDFKRREDMRQEGLIDYVSRGSRNLWHLRIFKATANEIQGTQQHPLATPS